jgi:hypothetical protein
MTRFLFALALGACCGTALAQTVTVSDDTGKAQTTESVDVAQDAPATKEPERTCLRSTGSRITSLSNRRAEKAGQPQQCANAFGRVYTEEDLERSGHMNIADALRSLDTRIR